MKLELIKDHNNKLGGYRIIRETEDELEAIEMVRDMYFWGHLGKIKYGGRESEGDTENTMVLKFHTKEYEEQERKEREESLEQMRQEMSSK